MMKKYYNSDNIGLVPLKAIVLTAIMIALIANIPVFALADAINPGVYSTASKPYGLTYGDWTVRS
jgi:hypothetical protein